MTQFSTRYELLRLGMGQEVAARRAFIATRGGLSWPTTIFCPSLSHLVLLNCWLKLAYYTTVIISGSLSACLLFQSNLAVSINIVKIIAWARSCRGGSWSCRGGRCRRTGCDVFSRQLCRECSRLVAAWTQTEDPWCLHKMFNSVWRALWLERRATIATWWQEIWNLAKLQYSHQVAARTLAAISESKQAKGLYVSPSLADNVKHIFDFFPFSPEVLKIIFLGQFSIAEQCRSWRIFLSQTLRY